VLNQSYSCKPVATGRIPSHRPHFRCSYGFTVHLSKITKKPGGQVNRYRS